MRGKEMTSGLMADALHSSPQSSRAAKPVIYRPWLGVEPPRLIEAPTVLGGSGSHYSILEVRKPRVGEGEPSP